MQSTEDGVWLASIIPWPSEGSCCNHPPAGGSGLCSVCLGHLLQAKPWEEEELWAQMLERGEGLSCQQGFCCPTQALQFPTL